MAASTLHRIGTEHEKLGFNLSDNSRMSYEQIEKLLQRLHNRFGWEPMMEAGKIIGVTLDGQSVTLEPGGQFELSGAPVDSLHKTCAEVNSHLYQASFFHHLWPGMLHCDCHHRDCHSQCHWNCDRHCHCDCHRHCDRQRLSPQVKAICEELGIGFLGVGFDPKWAIKDIPMMPKDR